MDRIVAGTVMHLASTWDVLSFSLICSTGMIIGYKLWTYIPPGW